MLSKVWKLSKIMKKYRLEDIKKDRVFSEPPQGYFDKLPGIIQAKTANKGSAKTRIYWIGALRLIPAAAAVALILFYTGVFQSKSSFDVDQVLSEVSTEDLIEYLGAVDLTTEQILEEVDFNELSLEFQNDTDDVLLEGLEVDDDAIIEYFGELEEVESLM